ncbi:MAG: two-component sensor histidine kinase [Actinobacteria bacterium]|nr:two-component sensor histidine kinase [Actinomycetota bacterium]MTA90353.1 two-component sensor histidine kinase [Actinomycetota bacterium]
MRLFSVKRARSELPQVDGLELVASQLIDVVASAGVVLDQSDLVFKSSPGAAQLGLIANGKLVHLALKDLVEQARAKAVAVEIETEIETGLNKDQTWIHAKAVQFGDRYVMLLVDDLTESKKLEDTRRDFVANVSHELKTPIGAISLLAEAITGATEDPVAVTRFAQSLQKESQRLANIVQELIQLSRVQGANLADTIDVVDLGTVIADAIDRNQLLANQNNIRLVSEIENSITLQGDYEMLVTAVRNLIENAILYSEPGGQVGVRVKVVHDVAEVTVTDSGIGIPESEQERIFERFYRVDPSRSRQTGGTGLGLSIVKHAASHHKGEIRIFSKVGVGSTFTLRLPVNASEEE